MSIATGTNDAGQYDNHYLVTLGAWSVAPNIDFGVSGSFRLIVSGFVYDGGPATLEVRVGDDPDASQNMVAASFSIPAGVNANDPFPVFCDLEMEGRYATIDPCGATLDGFITVWGYPV